MIVAVKKHDAKPALRSIGLLSNHYTRPRARLRGPYSVKQNFNEVAWPLWHSGLVYTDGGTRC